MRTIISDDIIKECWNILSIYDDKEYIIKIIKGNYPHISKEKEQTVSELIRFYFKQSNELYYASDTSIITSPLTLFYSINNLVKALYLLKFPNLSISGSHGLTIKNDNVKNINEIGDIAVSIE